MQTQERDSVFISYSHEDLHYLEKMKRHFSIFKDKVNIWDDSKILPGQKWRISIDAALDKAKVAILLISADFLNSKFIAEVELPALLKAAENNGAIILSIIVKPCLFGEYSEINQFQAINSPSKALSQMAESDQEEVFVKLSIRLKQLFNK